MARKIRGGVGVAVVLYFGGPRDGENEAVEKSSPPLLLLHTVEHPGGRRVHAYRRHELRAVTTDGTFWWAYKHAGSRDECLPIH